MTITEGICSAPHLASSRFAAYPARAGQAVLNPTVDALPGSQAQRTWRLEVIHTEAHCNIARTDTCVVITATGPGLRFVDPRSAARSPCIRCCCRLENPAPDDPASEPMADGARTSGPAVCIVAQTAPAGTEIGAGAGYLRHMPDRPGDGWTVGVGAWHQNGPEALAGLPLGVTVSARRDWSARTGAATVVAP